jgi:hypothetical protein
MHEPLPREMRINHGPGGVLELVWACALVVILAVAFVGIAVIVGKLSLSQSGQAVDPSRQAVIGAIVSAARDQASSTSDLFSGMPLP